MLKWSSWWVWGSWSFVYWDLMLKVPTAENNLTLHKAFIFNPFLHLKKRHCGKGNDNSVITDVLRQWPDLAVGFLGVEMQNLLFSKVTDVKFMTAMYNTGLKYQLHSGYKIILHKLVFFMFQTGSTYFNMPRILRGQRDLYIQPVLMACHAFFNITFRTV